MHDIWSDPMVKEALKERPPEQIAVMMCPDCSGWGYYNEGSHFTCRFCDLTFMIDDLDGWQSDFVWLADFEEEKNPESGWCRRCRKCGCTDHDCSGCIARTGQPCRWVEQDLCSACCDFIPEPNSNNLHTR